MTLSPWVIGQTHPVWALTWQDDTGNPVDLTAATITGKIAPPSGASVALKNTPAIITANIGRFNYSVAANEVAVAGTYMVQFIATFPTTDPLYSDPISIDFVAAT